MRSFSINPQPVTPRVSKGEELDRLCLDKPALSKPFTLRQAQGERFSRPNTLENPKGIYPSSKKTLDKL